MKNIILTVGASCSGKSSWAEEFVRNRDGWVNLNRDDLRFSGLFGPTERIWSEYKFSKPNEKKVTQYIDSSARLAVQEHKNIIVSDTNLSEKARNKWKEFAAFHKYQYEEKYFVESWETLKERNQQRFGGISESILRDQYYRMQKIVGDFKYKPDPSLKDCVIVDIDGTVAFKSDDRGYYDWKKVGLDKPRQFVISMLWGLIDSGYFPIFLSGRDGSCVEETSDWIYENVTLGDEGYALFMREPKDMRKDYIVKRELFMKYVNGKYNVCGVLDDRPSVITNCWLDMGLPNVISTADQTLSF